MKNGKWKPFMIKLQSKMNMKNSNSAQPTFSIILPFFKQNDHANEVILDFYNTLKKAQENFEIIAVFNGESGMKKEMEEKTDPSAPLVKKILLKKSGWGLAVKAGMAKAQGQYICYTNSARTSPEGLLKLMQYAKVSTDVVLKTTRIKRENSWRKLATIFYNLENRIVLKTPIWDVNATPKIIPRKILDTIELKNDGDVIDAELMYKCFRKNVPIMEMPINTIERRSGKSTTNFLSALKMFWGLIFVKRDYEKNH